MDFLSNPDLATIHPTWPGTPHERGRFRAYDGEIEVGLGKVIRYLLRRNPQAAAKRRDRYAPPVERGDIHRAGDWVCWLGHASFLIQLDGVRYLTDPVWHNLGLLKRRVPTPFTPEQIGRVDYLLLSHDHRDHCDERTISELSRKLDFRVLAPLRLGRVVEPWLARGTADHGGRLVPALRHAPRRAQCHVYADAALVPPLPHRHQPSAVGELRVAGLGRDSLVRRGFRGLTAFRGSGTVFP